MPLGVTVTEANANNGCQTETVLNPLVIQLPQQFRRRRSSGTKPDGEIERPKCTESLPTDEVAFKPESALLKKSWAEEVRNKLAERDP